MLGIAEEEVLISKESLMEGVGGQSQTVVLGVVEERSNDADVELRERAEGVLGRRLLFHGFKGVTVVCY